MKKALLLFVICVSCVIVYGIIQPYNRGGNYMAGMSPQLAAEMGNWQYVNDAYKSGTIDRATYDKLYGIARGQNNVAGWESEGTKEIMPIIDAAKIQDPQAAARAQAAAAEAQRRAANQAARDNTQKAIDSLGTELDVGYRNIDDQANSITSRYDKEASRNEADYNEQTVSNNNSLLKNKQNSLLAAAQGARGLRGVLSSVNALGGDGAKLANRAVTNAANQDIGGAVDTAAGNAQVLDKAIGTFREDDEDRRNALATDRTNQRTALEGSIETKRQGYLQKMADLFGDIGDTGNATRLLNDAGNLNQTIAQKSRVQAAPLSARSAAFTPGSLTDYMAGAGDMTVSTAEGSTDGLAASPNSILAGRKKDERKRTALV